MKKTFSILLLVVIAFNIVGFTTMFLIMQNEAKKEMGRDIAEKSKEEDIELLVFNEKEFYSGKEIRIVNNKEFIYKSSIYDIVRTETKNGKIYIWCINDTKETTLIKHYQENGNSDETRSLKEICNYKFFSIIAILDRIEKQLFQKYELISYSKIYDYNSIILDKKSPPPKFYFC